MCEIDARVVDEHDDSSSGVLNFIEIPGMMIQPLAENAIVHGLSPKGESGSLSIKLLKQNGNLIVRVTDNGVGLPPKSDDTLRQKGFGLKLVEERLQLLNYNGKIGSLNVVNNNSNGSIGTTAELVIPME